MKTLIVLFFLFVFVGCKESNDPGIIGGGYTENDDIKVIYNNYRFIHSGDLDSAGNKDVVIYSIQTNQLPLVAVYIHQTNVFKNVNFLIGESIIKIRAGIEFANLEFKIVVIN